jgi:hypothetical protein
MPIINHGIRIEVTTFQMGMSASPAKGYVALQRPRLMHPMDEMNTQRLDSIKRETAAWI